MPTVLLTSKRIYSMLHTKSLHIGNIIRWYLNKSFICSSFTPSWICIMASTFTGKRNLSASALDVLLFFLTTLAPLLSLSLSLFLPPPAYSPLYMLPDKFSFTYMYIMSSNPHALEHGTNTTQFCQVFKEGERQRGKGYNKWKSKHKVWKAKQEEEAEEVDRLRKHTLEIWVKKMIYEWQVEVPTVGNGMKWKWNEINMLFHGQLKQIKKKRRRKRKSRGQGKRKCQKRANESEKRVKKKSQSCSSATARGTLVAEREREGERNALKMQ